jgi:hypothetical protein
MLFGLCVCTMIVINVDILVHDTCNNLVKHKGLLLGDYLLASHYISSIDLIMFGTKYINYFTTLCPIRLWS